MEPAVVFDPLHLHCLGFHFLHNGQKRLQVRQQNRSQGCDCVIVGAVEKIEAAFEYLRVSPLGRLAMPVGLVLPAQNELS